MSQHPPGCFCARCAGAPTISAGDRGGTTPFRPTNRSGLALQFRVPGGSPGATVERSPGPGGPAAETGGSAALLPVPVRPIGGMGTARDGIGDRVRCRADRVDSRPCTGLGCRWTDLHTIHPPRASRNRLKREAFCYPLCPFGSPSGTPRWDRSGCPVNCDNVERSGSGTGVAGCPDLFRGRLQKRVSGAEFGTCRHVPMCPREGGLHLVD